MKQTVLLGLGGTGSRVVNNVAKILNKKNIPLNDGFVTCAVLDTNQLDNDSINDTNTGIPVIPTCDERSIGEYLRLYAGTNPRRWCPYSPSFDQQSMINGASEIRVKSRIAFMDTMNTDKIDKLKETLATIFHNRSGQPESINVMLVSSVAGGTGAGMFIQVALWLRKFFDERNCKQTIIKGVFLLPDMFINNLSNIKRNTRKKMYHYANAYASIRELNALNKIIAGKYKPEQRIVIDDLFDSDNPPAKPIVDYGFFIDNMDSNGAEFNDISLYEEMVAQIVYMQLYAPMHREILSVEDNLYRSFETSQEPVFGSCGTSRAEYPSDKVAEYCALRAASQAVSEGWNRIDSEIDDLIAEERNAEKDGYLVKNPINRRDMFIQLLDEKTSKEEGHLGRDDVFFVGVKKDTFNESRDLVGNGNETDDIAVCKAVAFMDMLNDKISSFIDEHGETVQITNLLNKLPKSTANDSDDKVSGKAASFKVTARLLDTLKGLPKKEENAVKNVVTTFEDNARDYASKIIRSIVPLDMGSVNKNDAGSLYGFFQKKDANGNMYFIHPVAAKYLLYKLSRLIEREQSTLAVEARRKKAIDLTKEVSFDNPNTKVVETLKNYWEDIRKVSSKGGALVTRDEVQNYINAYRKYNKANVLLCRQFEASLLKQLVLKELSKYVKKLITAIEAIFDDFDFVQEKLDKDIEANVAANEKNNEKVIYVYAKRAHKEKIYNSLDIDLTGRNEDLYREVIDAVYGNFCAVERPNAKANKPYAEVSVVRKFYDSLKESFADIIENNRTYREKIYFDIVDAIYKESDYAADSKKSGKRVNPLDEESASGIEKKRHSDAVQAYKDKLEYKAAPFLIAQPDEALAVISNIDGLTIDENHDAWVTDQNGNTMLASRQTMLTFWGFHPDVAAKHSVLATKLEANKTTAQSEGYGVNELYCYSSIYGVKAEAVDKFNEKGNGAYYTNYCRVINDMIANKSEVDTPHIDKTWHEILPYVSSSMEAASAQIFANTFWRAIAFGYIIVDKEGYYQIMAPHKDNFGVTTDRPEYLLDQDNEKIKAADVCGLITALQQYPTFELDMANKLEAKYKDSIKTVTKYIDNEFISGLLTKGDLNPATILTRYIHSRGVDMSLKDDLATSLRLLLREVASKYDTNRDAIHIDEAKTKLCYRIYELCPMATKTALLQNWGPDFKLHKLISADTDITGSMGEAEDII